MNLDKQFLGAKYAYVGVRICHLVFNFCYFVYTVNGICEKGHLPYFIVTFIDFMMLYTSFLLIIIKFRQEFIGAYMEGVIFCVSLTLYTIITISKVTEINYLESQDHISGHNHISPSRLTSLNNVFDTKDEPTGYLEESSCKYLINSNSKIRKDIILNIMEHYSEIDAKFGEHNKTDHFSSIELQEALLRLEKRRIYWYYVFPSFFSVFIQLSVVVASFYHRRIIIRRRKAAEEKQKDKSEEVINNLVEEAV